MKESTIYSIRVRTTNEPFNHELEDFIYESENPLIILGAYGRYKKIFNPETTTIRLSISRKSIEDLSEAELRLAIEKQIQSTGR